MHLPEKLRYVQFAVLMHLRLVFLTFGGEVLPNSKVFFLATDNACHVMWFQQENSHQPQSNWSTSIHFKTRGRPWTFQPWSYICETYNPDLVEWKLLDLQFFQFHVIWVSVSSLGFKTWDRFLRANPDPLPQADPGGPAPLPKRFFQNHAVFRQFQGKNPIFWAHFGLRAPTGVKTLLAPPACLHTSDLRPSSDVMTSRFAHASQFATHCSWIRACVLTFRRITLSSSGKRFINLRIKCQELIKTKSTSICNVNKTRPRTLTQKQGRNLVMKITRIHTVCGGLQENATSPINWQRPFSFAETFLLDSVLFFLKSKSTCKRETQCQIEQQIRLTYLEGNGPKTISNFAGSTVPDVAGCILFSCLSPISHHTQLVQMPLHTPLNVTAQAQGFGFLLPFSFPLTKKPHLNAEVTPSEQTQTSAIFCMFGQLWTGFENWDWLNLEKTFVNYWPRFVHWRHYIYISKQTQCLCFKNPYINVNAAFVPPVHPTPVPNRTSTLVCLLLLLAFSSIFLSQRTGTSR